MKSAAQAPWMLKTGTQVGRELKEKGISVTDWAMANGIPPAVVFDLIRGATKGTRGKAREAAIKLGMRSDPMPHRRAA